MSPVLRNLWICLMSTWTAAVSFSQPVISGGAVLTKQGSTLYTFENDVVGSGKSVCNAPCSNIFPPYLAEKESAATGLFTLVIREDGTKQWSYKGMPLYKFYADEKPGDVGGDGMNRNLWHIARQ
jgi:predicted lipoprotein with Yx(FWY)xxD motif